MIVILCIIQLVFPGKQAVAVKLETFRIVDTIRVKNISKSKLFKFAEDWFAKEKPQLKLVRKNEEQYILEGKGYLLYYNHVSMEDVLLSPRAAERTNGTIVYFVRVSIQDSIVVAEFSEFTHDAYFNEYGKLSFGVLFDYETAPPGKCMENKQWCNMVWKEMKDKSRAEAVDRSSRLIPESAQRKKGKAFKVEKDEVKVDAKKENPDDYLKIENYIMKDEEDTVKTTPVVPSNKSDEETGEEERE